MDDFGHWMTTLIAHIEEMTREQVKFGSCSQIRDALEFLMFIDDYHSRDSMERIRKMELSVSAKKYLAGVVATTDVLSAKAEIITQVQIEVN